MTMDAYTMNYTVRWADIDANRHVHYSAYVDSATELRLRFFAEHNLPPEIFDLSGMGPVFTSLAANFYREVRLGETITITFQMAGLSEQGLRWRICHDFLKANGKQAVALTIEGTFISMTTRRPVIPTPEILSVFRQAPRSDDFEILPEGKWFEK
jgi:acyl-CoA thioester hydrolase